MIKFRKLLNHFTVILSLMFIVFLVLDQFNPMMNFVDNPASHWLLAALCAGGILQAVLGWREESSRDRAKTQFCRIDDP